MKFTIQKSHPSSRARTGLLETPHGTVRTPAFMPVATRAAVKTLDPDDLRTLGVEIVLSNTYHLALRPGSAEIEKMGGLHRFMGWEGPILTDSGGYQVFSLAKMRTVSEEGATFQSHLDGSTHVFTPEEVVRHQERLGVDIAMPLDHLVPNPSERPVVEEALARTQRWFDRSVAAHSRVETSLFGIVQGGLFPDLREKSIQSIMEHDPPGLAVGGLSVGEKNEELHDIAARTASMIPANKPRYLMGIGTPADIEKAVHAGYDLFDCVLPTRSARTGLAYTSEGDLKIRNAKYAGDESPLDPSCTCPACRRFSRAYLRHCILLNEPTGIRLMTLHNLWFYLRLLDRLRKEIGETKEVSS